MSLIDDADRILARAKINRAQRETARINDVLWESIRCLQGAGCRSNGAGIFSDLSRFRSALAEAAIAIKRAQDIVKATDWPTDNDYDIT
jgi:hypothetical protein